MFDIKEQLKILPDRPGVYIMKNIDQEVIYVGKAISLKNRVRQYFQSGKNQASKVRAMVANINNFEYIVTDSELEALILECNLIKKYRPKYNVLLRDDKTYPYIKVTLNEEYPRGEIMKIDYENKLIEIEQHLDHNSREVFEALAPTEDAVFILKRNNHHWQIDFQNLRVGDVVGIVFTKDNGVRGVVDGD